jgi:type III restriction enzyme
VRQPGGRAAAWLRGEHADGDRDRVYEQFAENLQKEIEADTGIRFGIVEHQFAAIAITGATGRPPRWASSSQRPVGHLRAAGYIDAKGKVQDSLKTALKDGTCPARRFERNGPDGRVLRKVSGRSR